MTTTGRLVRGLATVVAVTLLVAGTVWGHDDHFPFGPFKMFAGAAQVDGAVGGIELWGTTSSGREERIGADEVGLRRAELEGQVSRFRQDPSLLRHLADSYDQRHPGGVRLVEVRMVDRIHHLSDRRVTGVEEHLVAHWQRP